MSKLTDDDVRYVAQLSKFNLSDEEIKRFKGDLEAILGYVEQLQEVDTEGIEPTAQVTGLVNQMREDDIKDYGVSSKDLLATAPDTQNNQIKVPKVL